MENNYKKNIVLLLDFDCYLNGIYGRCKIRKEEYLTSTALRLVDPRRYTYEFNCWIKDNPELPQIALSPDQVAEIHLNR